MTAFLIAFILRDDKGKMLNLKKHVQLFYLLTLVVVTTAVDYSKFSPVDYCCMISYHFRISCWTRWSNKLTTVHLMEVMRAIRTHCKINHVVVHDGRRSDPSCLYPLWIEIILAEIGMVRKMTHCVVALPFYNRNVGYKLIRNQNPNSACVRHHNQLQSARESNASYARTLCGAR